MKTEQMQTPKHENINNGVGRLNKISDRDDYIYGRAIKDKLHSNPRLVHEQKGEPNWLLFGITVAAIAGVLGSVIFFAMPQTLNPFIKTAPVSSQS